MSSLLLTQSLLSDWQWYLQDESENARAKFETALRREDKPDTPEMQSGRAFESRVRLINEPEGDWLTECDETDLTETEDDITPEYLEAVIEIAKMTSGGFWQASLSRGIVIDGQAFVLYGRLDVLKLGIIDIKFSRTFEVGKYRNCPQVRMYMYLAPSAPDMIFAVSDGKKVMTDSFIRADVEPIEPLVRDFWTWLQTQPSLLAIYREHWISKGE
jgi:hypothetical protein